MDKPKMQEVLDTFNEDQKALLHMIVAGVMREKKLIPMTADIFDPPLTEIQLHAAEVLVELCYEREGGD